MVTGDEPHQSRYPRDLTRKVLALGCQGVGMVLPLSHVGERREPPEQHWSVELRVGTVDGLSDRLPAGSRLSPTWLRGRPMPLWAATSLTAPTPLKFENQ